MIIWMKMILKLLLLFDLLLGEIDICNVKQIDGELMPIARHSKRARMVYEKR